MTYSLKPSVIYKGHREVVLRTLLDNNVHIVDFRPPVAGELFVAAPQGDRISIFAKGTTEEIHPRFIVRKFDQSKSLEGVWE